MDPGRILACPIQAEGKETTLRQYFADLAAEVWIQGEGFSGKRPFGDSGWAWDVYQALKTGLAGEAFTDRDVIDAIRSMGRDG